MALALELAQLAAWILGPMVCDLYTRLGLRQVPGLEEPMTTKRFCAYALLLGWLAAAFGVLFVGYNQGPATLRMGPPIQKPPLPPPGPAPTPLATQLLDAHNQQRASARPGAADHQPQAPGRRAGPL